MLASGKVAWTKNRAVAGPDGVYCLAPDAQFGSRSAFAS
jgi:hypothetical protein